MKAVFSILLIALATLAAPAPAAEIRVFAAASLTDAMSAVGPVYQRASGDRLLFNFAGSNTLARQIEEGAPADVIVSADEQTMNRLQQRKLIDAATRVSILSNTLVVVVPRARGQAVRSIADLAAPRFGAIALAQPDSVPAGVYAREYLVKKNLWTAVARKIVPTENVRAALAAVESGDVDAAIVYRTDALISRRVRIALQIPRAEGPRISFPAAVVSDSREKLRARRFIDWLRTPAAAQILARFGFEPLR